MKNSNTDILLHTVDFDLSVDQSCLESNNLNMSELFNNQDSANYEKMISKLRKNDHKLIEKTTIYIHSLKDVISENK